MRIRGLLNYLPDRNAFIIQNDQEGHEAVIDRPGLLKSDAGEEIVAFPYTVALVDWIGKRVEWST